MTPQQGISIKQGKINPQRLPQTFPCSVGLLKTWISGVCNSDIVNYNLIYFDKAGNEPEAGLVALIACADKTLVHKFVVFQIQLAE